MDIEVTYVKGVITDNEKTEYYKNVTGLYYDDSVLRFNFEGRFYCKVNIDKVKSFRVIEKSKKYLTLYYA